jgi:hypothetical protein
VFRISVCGSGDSGRLRGSIRFLARVSETRTEICSPKCTRTSLPKSRK